MSTSTSSIGDFPHHPDDVTPQWLSARLQSKGLLNTGKIVSIDSRFLGGIYLAKSAILKIHYDQEKTDGPQSLFIKISDPDEQFGDVSAGEIAFFRQHYPTTLPIIQCIDSFIDEESGKGCLLLEDISQTHTQHPWPLPPTMSQCKAIVLALAQVHSYWWNSPALESTNENSLHFNRQRRIADQLPSTVPSFVNYLGDRLTRNRKEIMYEVCRQLPRLLAKRICSTQSTTLIHGDPHFWNFMIPINSKTHRPIIIDWEEWNRGVCGYDLAYMIAYQWNQDRRDQHEIPLLHLYHEELIKRSVCDYCFNDLIDDYRLGCLRNFMIPAFQHAMGLEPSCWWQNLEQLYLSFDSLQCHSLLE